ncbi:RNA polymerase sigma factor [Mangrovivirga sp. M17]|uniref:RNA polymerase sigma factor n=1 Tax=Mangrovivirga halotolerans TaxID=2993936 RepID=A0ABT3RSF5_9BACT|nr:RNA polymerase sigma factor [Mangrovivirga halotolerans]MCX2744722.1 RNA polymerase sigma factor [Mangrovivirga halotolerans]
MTALEFGYRLNSLRVFLKPYAYRLTRDNDEANDLLQETVLKAFSNREKFSEGTNIKAWLYTIMKNTFITNYQKKVRQKTFVDKTDNDHYINSSKHTIENGAYGNFKMKDIKRSIKKLDDNYKVPFMMHYKGYKYYEIAEHLNVPIGTVKNRIHLARKELKEMLQVYRTI